MLMNDLQHTLKDQTDEKYYETCQGYLSQLKLTISISNIAKLLTMATVVALFRSEFHLFEATESR